MDNDTIKNTLSTDASVACSFLKHLSPSQLVSLLARWSNKYDNHLNPIWLHNQGQNIIGFMPKSCFYLLPPTENNDISAHNLQVLTLSRKTLPNFSTLIEQNLLHNPQNISSNDLQMHLVNNQSTDEFVKQLIEYSEQCLIENNHSPIHNQNNKNNKDGLESNYFTDGLIGFISYDAMANNLINNSKKQTKNTKNSQKYFQTTQPAAFFGHYPLYLTCEINQNIHYWQLHATSETSQNMMGEVQAWIQHIIKKTKPLIYKPLPLYLAPRWSNTEYSQAFTKVQDYLHAGDCYQVNLTQEWCGKLSQGTHLADYVSKLHTFTNSPFSGYFHIINPRSSTRVSLANPSQSQTKSTKFELLSCSPELFFNYQKTAEGNYHIHTKPIKGTRPRGRTEEEDTQLKTELANSEKDLAENVMIVDLLRNDLGKYAKTGSVKVPKSFAIESFSNVHHMVSTIHATLKHNTHPLEMLFGSLPAGSITGTPKKRSVEIINELEQKPRGAYCGTMGYMNFNGTGQWNVLIRSLQANQEEVSLWAGGGITVASNCNEEYQECFDKVGNLLDILAN